MGCSSKNVPQVPGATIAEPSNEKHFSHADTIRYGVNMSAEGEIRAKLVFARFEGDVIPWHHWDSFPDEGNPAKAEGWMRAMLDGSPGQETTEYANISHFFRSASLGKLNVFGDVYYISVPDSFMGRHYGQANAFVLEKLFGEGSALPKPLSAYDQWNTVQRNLHVREPGGTLDFVIVVYRRPPGMPHPFGATWNGIAGLGFDRVEVQDGKDIRGWGLNGSGLTQLFMRNPVFTFNTLIHETAHLLLGSSHPYPGSSSVHPGYWGLFFTMNANLSINAAERMMLGWSQPQKLSGNPQTIQLGDFITTGESAYFELPDGSLLFLEHRMKSHRATGVHSTYDNASRDPEDTGLFLYRAMVPYRTSGQSLIPIVSDGNHDWSITGISDVCGSVQPVLKKGAPNPFGNHFRDIFTLDQSSESIDRRRGFNLAVSADVDPDRCTMYGNGVHFPSAFRHDGNRILSTWTNPPAAFPDGRPFGINLYINEVVDGKMSVTVSSDPFFADVFPELKTTQDFFVMDGLTVPENVVVTLVDNAKIMITKDAVFIVDGMVMDEYGNAISGRKVGYRELKEAFPGRVRLIEPGTGKLHWPGE